MIVGFVLGTRFPVEVEYFRVSVAPAAGQVSPSVLGKAKKRVDMCDARELRSGVLQSI
jgi:hypothetical protein